MNPTGTAPTVASTPSELIYGRDLQRLAAVLTSFATRYRGDFYRWQANYINTMEKSHSPQVVTLLGLTGQEFDAAVEGRANETGKIIGPWLAPVTLKYYMRRSWCAYLRDADQRMFFLAVLPEKLDADTGKTLRECVGAVELQVSPYNDAEIWLKYVSVAPAYSRRGIARQLLAMMAQHLKEHPRKLVRSRATDEGAQAIQGFLDELLQQEHLSWSQTGRETAAAY